MKLKKYFQHCLSLLLFLAALSLCAHCFAGMQQYVITAPELERLELNLTALYERSEKRRQELLMLQSRSETLAGKLQQSEQSLRLLQEKSEQTESSLQNANALLQQYAQEQKRTRSRLRRQRTLAWCVAGGIFLYAVQK